MSNEKQPEYARLIDVLETPGAPVDRAALIAALRHLGELSAEIAALQSGRSPATDEKAPPKTSTGRTLALAGEIVDALLADANDGGYDLEAGLFGPSFSALVRRLAGDSTETPAKSKKPIKPCPTCGAPCYTTVRPRGGDHGWGTTDEQRTVYNHVR